MEFNQKLTPNGHGHSQDKYKDKDEDKYKCKDKDDDENSDDKKGQVCFLGTPGGARSKVGNKWEQDKQSQRGRIMLWSDERKTPKNQKKILIKSASYYVAG